jgi:hypothetical protein
MDERGGPLRVEMQVSPAEAARIFEKYCTTPVGGSFVFQTGGVRVSVVKRSPASPAAAKQLTADVAEPKPKRFMAVHSSPATVTRMHTKEHYKYLKDAAMLSKVQAMCTCPPGAPMGTEWSVEKAARHVEFAGEDGDSWFKHYNAFFIQFLMSEKGIDADVKAYYDVVGGGAGPTDWSPQTAPWWVERFKNGATASARAIIDKAVATVGETPTDIAWWGAAFGQESTAPEADKKRYADALKQVPFEATAVAWWRRFFSDNLKFVHSEKKRDTAEAARKWRANKKPRKDGDDLSGIVSV